MKKLTKEEKIIKIIRWVLLLNGALFIFFAGFHVFRGAGIIAGLFVVDGIIFLGLNRVIEKRNKWIFWLAVIFIGVNIFLTITDEFGWIDFFILVIECVLFVMILGNRKVLSANSKFKI